MKEKYELYEESGVKEYWVIHPLDEIVTVYVLENSKYNDQKPVVDEFIVSKLFPDLKIHTDDIF